MNPRWKRVWPFLLTGLFACGPHKSSPPPPPPIPQVSVDLQLYCGTSPAIDREVYLDNAAGNQSGRSNQDGWIRFVVPASLRTATLRVNDKGDCFRLDRDLALPGLDSQPAIEVRLPLKPPPFVLAGEQGTGRVIVRGADFVYEQTGQPFTWRGSSEFMLYWGYLRGKLTDLSKQLDQRATAGANVLRVFLTFNWTEWGGDKLVVANEPNFYSSLSSFLALLYERGFRVELVLFGDAPQFPTRASQEEYVRRVADIVASAPNVFVEVANEPQGGDKNIVGNGERAVELGRLIQGHGFPVASGWYDLPIDATSFPHLDYQTVHSDRGPEWMRKSKELMDWRDGFGWASGLSFPGLHIPIVGDEPMGLNEVASDDRSTSAEDAAAYAAISGLFGAGSTAHTEAGLNFQMWGPVQTRAAKAWFDALKWIPASARFAPYQRGDGQTPEGVGNMPLIHHGEEQVDGTVRLFCKEAAGYEWCVAAKPNPAWQPVPRRGCAIVEQPIRGLVKLQCPDPARKEDR